jgi:hypothetical protein
VNVSLRTLLLLPLLAALAACAVPLPVSRTLPDADPPRSDGATGDSYEGEGIASWPARDLDVQLAGPYDGQLAVSASLTGFVDPFADAGEACPTSFPPIQAWMGRVALEVTLPDVSEGAVVTSRTGCPAPRIEGSVPVNYRDQPGTLTLEDPSGTFSVGFLDVVSGTTLRGWPDRVRPGETLAVSVVAPPGAVVAGVQALLGKNEWVDCWDGDLIGVTCDWWTEATLVGDEVRVEVPEEAARGAVQVQLLVDQVPPVVRCDFDRCSVHRVGVNPPPFELTVGD